MDPAGGWLPFRSEELSLAFEYPKAYEDGECGSPWITQKSVGDNEYHLIGLGSSIRISVFGRWASELDDVVRTRRLPPTLQLLSDVEGFTLGGESAFRYVFLVTQDPGAFEYAKSAWSLHRGKLYLFNYMDVEDLKRCDAPPISEDAVYEHVLSSFEFLR